MLSKNEEQRIFIHADDFGLCDEATERIVDTVENGCLNSTSIMCNMPGFENAVRAYDSIRDSVRLCVHINLVEGTPSATSSDIAPLRDGNGEFRYSFFNLWRAFATRSREDRAALRTAVRAEVDNQLTRFVDAFGADHPVRVDSHMHFHMIPFVFDVILELRDKYDIEFIRNPYELKYWSKEDSKNYVGSNPAKNILLNRLARRKISESDKQGITSNAYFIGVLATGRMTHTSVEAALKRLSAKQATGSIDILFHPGGVSGSSDVHWTSRQMFKEYYASPNRRMEADLLKSDSFINLIREYEGVFSHR